LPGRREPAGRLVLCATPIGNLEDVTLRVLRALGEADVLACEDTRHTRRLLERHGIKPRGQVLSYHEHNERQRAAELVEKIQAGAVVALVSDAGMPGISDPAAVLVVACREAGLAVDVLPGPSAVITAVVTAGLPAESWRFIGFLPRKKSELGRAFEGERGTLVAFESPRRLGSTLAVLARIDPERPVAVCRELTKMHEEVARGTAAALAERFAEGTRGEVVLVIGPATEIGTDPREAVAAVGRLVEAGARRRVAASVVSGLTGVPANTLYRASEKE
jgi:16S rRNA (cytidine1402-2'-O)-methyltransferase